MTKWTIVLEAHSAADDSNVFQLMKRAAQLGLKYSVISKDAEPKTKPENKPGRVGGTV